MKKTIAFVKKHDNILIFVIFAILLLKVTYNISINNNDELINFLNTYKMSKGLTIYQDTNVIITPLFFYLGEIILNIFGNNILVFRTYNLILSTIIYWLCYQILKVLKINKRLSLLYTILIMMFTYGIIGAGANYNVLAYIFFELGVLLILKMKHGTKKDIFQGIILFLVFFSNQKLAAGYFVALVIYAILNKNIKSLIKELAMTAILVVIYFIYLYTQNNLHNFINYTILGIGEFGAKNTIFRASFITNIIPVLSAVFAIAIYIVLVKLMPKYEKDNSEEKIKRLRTMLVFSLCTLVLIMPIVNVYHMQLASVLILVTFMYEIHLFIYPIIDNKKSSLITSTIIGILLIILTILSIKEIINYIMLVNTIPIDSPFYGSLIEEDLQKEIEDVTAYIKDSDKEVIVLSSYAPFYSIILNDLDNNEYDWALRGNLGTEGEEGLTSKIKDLKDTQILIYGDEESDEMYQFVFDTVNYIKGNMRYIGKIRNFSIYETVD